MIFNRYWYNWKAVGCYHSCTPELNESYSKKIYKTIREITYNKLNKLPR